MTPPFDLDVSAEIQAELTETLRNLAAVLPLLDSTTNNTNRDVENVQNATRKPNSYLGPIGVRTPSGSTITRETIGDELVMFTVTSTKFLPAGRLLVANVTVRVYSESAAKDVPEHKANHSSADSDGVAVDLGRKFDGFKLNGGSSFGNTANSGKAEASKDWKSELIGRNSVASDNPNKSLRIRVDA